MNRKRRIIISITSITLVLLILVGLTYAYFLSNISGNTGEKSISTDTANLSLVYEEDDPSIITATKIGPGTTIGNKTFTVTNNGNVDTDYLIVIEGVSITYSTTSNGQVQGEPASFVSNDFVYTLTCSSSDEEDCNQVTEETALPLVNNSILVSNKIAAGATQTYVMTVKYLETGIDQSDDMNKKLEAKINIKDIRDPDNNPYISNTNSLAYNIINNSLLKKNGTELRNMPLTTPAEETSNSNEKVLALTPDDYGISYYFRGSVIDNYVDFAGMCWRIVRIDGDGNIKLILEDKDTSCEDIDYENGDGNWDIATTPGGNVTRGNFGYGTVEVDSNKSHNYFNYINPSSNSISEAQVTAYKNFQETTNGDYKSLSDIISDMYNNADIDDYLVSGRWCYNNAAYTAGDGTGTLIGDIENYLVYSYQQCSDCTVTIYYDTYIRLANTAKKPTLKCNGMVMDTFYDNTTEMYVATLTADEVVFAGAASYDVNDSYYLLNSYEADNNLRWWTLSPKDKETAIREYYDNYLIFDGYDSNISGVRSEASSFRPAVQLKFGTTISSGDGTIDHPYVIS